MQRPNVTATISINNKSVRLHYPHRRKMRQGDGKWSFVDDKSALLSIFCFHYSHEFGMPSATQKITYRCISSSQTSWPTSIRCNRANGLTTLWKFILTMQTIAEFSVGGMSDRGMLLRFIIWIYYLCVDPIEASTKSPHHHDHSILIYFRLREANRIKLFRNCNIFQF